MLIKILGILASIFGLALLAEIALRITMGLGKPELYLADPEIGYLLAPNQKLRRSGNLIEINQYSMRHQEITPQKTANTKRVFLLGDSIVYGTWHIDQTQILSALLAEQLKKDSGKEAIEVFNASTNSWAPRNELAYLKRFGLFDADVLILVINTDDLFAPQPSSFVVGRSPNYPDKVPFLALIELYRFNFVQPKLIPELEKLKQAEVDRPGANIAAIKEIKAIADKSNTRFILALTPLLREFKEESEAEIIEARKQLEELVNQENIEYIDFLKVWADFPQPEFLYRDHIHPSPQGNYKITETFAQYL